MKKNKEVLKKSCIVAVLLSLVVSGTCFECNLQAAPAAGDNTGNELSYSQFSRDNEDWQIALNGAEASYIEETVPTIGPTNVQKISWSSSYDPGENSNAYAIQNLENLDLSSDYRFTMWTKINAESELSVPFTSRIIVSWEGASALLEQTPLTSTENGWVKYETVFSFNGWSEMDRINTAVSEGKTLSYQLRIVLPHQNEQNVDYYFTDACLTKLIEDENLMPATNLFAANDTGRWWNAFGEQSAAIVANGNYDGWNVTTSYDSTTAGNSNSPYAQCQINDLDGTKTYRLAFDLKINQEIYTTEAYDQSDITNCGAPFTVYLPTNSWINVVSITSTNGIEKHFEYTFTFGRDGDHYIKFHFARPGQGKEIVYNLSNMSLTEEKEENNNLCFSEKFLDYDGGINFSMDATSFWLQTNPTNVNYEIIKDQDHGNTLKLTSQAANGSVADLRTLFTIEQGKNYNITYWAKIVDTQPTTPDTCSSIWSINRASDVGEASLGWILPEENGWIKITHPLTGLANGQFMIDWRFYLNTENAEFYLADFQVVDASSVISEIAITNANYADYKWNTDGFAFEVGDTSAQGYTVTERWSQCEKGSFYTSDATINQGLKEKETFTANTFEAGNTHRYSLVVRPKAGYTIDENVTITINGTPVNKEVCYSDETGRIIIYPGEKLFTTVAGDCTKDGKANVCDLVRMKRYASDSASVSVFFEEACNFDNVSGIGTDDLNSMRNVLAGSR